MKMMKQASKGCYEQLLDKNEYVYDKSRFSLKLMIEGFDEYYNGRKWRQIHERNLEIIEENAKKKSSI